MAVKRMATLLFLGAVTMLLLGALVYLAATSGRPKRQPVPHSEGWNCCEPGPGRLANPQSRLWPRRMTSASYLERSVLQKPWFGPALWY